MVGEQTTFYSKKHTNDVAYSQDIVTRFQLMLFLSCKSMNKRLNISMYKHFAGLLKLSVHHLIAALKLPDNLCSDSLESCKGVNVLFRNIWYTPTTALLNILQVNKDRHISKNAYLMFEMYNAICNAWIIHCI